MTYSHYKHYISLICKHNVHSFMHSQIHRFIHRLIGSFVQNPSISLPVFILGLLSPGIYRKNGVNSHITELLKRFHNDARSVSWSESDFSVDDVANTLKRFLREVKDGVLNGQDNAKSWLNAAGEEQLQYVAILRTFFICNTYCLC